MINGVPQDTVLNPCLIYIINDFPDYVAFIYLLVYSYGLLLMTVLGLSYLCPYFPVLFLSAIIQIPSIILKIVFKIIVNTITMHDYSIRVL